MGFDGVAVTNMGTTESFGTSMVPIGSAAGGGTRHPRRPRSLPDHVVFAAHQIVPATKVYGRVVANSAAKYSFSRLRRKNGVGTEKFSDEKRRQFNQVPPPGGWTVPWTLQGENATSGFVAGFLQLLRLLSKKGWNEYYNFRGNAKTAVLEVSCISGVCFTPSGVSGSGGFALYLSLVIAKYNDSFLLD